MIQQYVMEYQEARHMVEALIAEVTRRGKAAVIVVADAHGELMALARMDGAPYSSITIAMNKAYTAARERKPSKEIGIASRDVEKGFDIGYFGDPKFTGWGGGVPILREGVVVGAVAVSGLPQVEDMELAASAARSFAEKS